MRFIIVCARRTGSTHLTEVLRRHPEILCHGEIFHPRNVWLHWPKTDLSDAAREGLLERRNTAPSAFLEDVFQRDYGHAHVGFKIFDGQNDDVMNKLLNDRRIAKIILYRKNVLASFSSALAARAVGQWAVRKGDDPPERVRVPFVEEEFVKFHDEYVGFFRTVMKKLNRKRQVFHLVNYDELNDRRLLACLVSFIGADPMRLPSDSGPRGNVKANPGDILSRFSNAGAAEEFLRRRDLLHWMHEGETAFELLGADEQASAEAAGKQESTIEPIGNDLSDQPDQQL